MILLQQRAAEEGRLGPQHPPIPGVHNSGWVQAPGAAVLADHAQYPRLEQYVKGVVGAFAVDARILAWNVWNEPSEEVDAATRGSSAQKSTDVVLKLVPRVFAWARDAHPSQPLTSRVFDGNWSSLDTMAPMARLQIEQFAVIGFFLTTTDPRNFERRVNELQQFHRPLICAKYIARSDGCTFDTILPIAHAHRVGAINWGLVAGKSQSYLPLGLVEAPPHY